MKEEEDEVVSVPLKRHSTLNRRTITSIVNSEEEGPVAALVRRVTEQIQEAVEAKTEASPASPTEAEAPVRRKTQLSLHVPGYAPYGYGYPPPPYPYYYAPPPPPHGYWAPPHPAMSPMTVQQ